MTDMPKSVTMKIDLNKAKEEKKILSGLVTACEDYKLSDDVDRRLLLVNCLGNMITIEEPEIVQLPYAVTLKSLVGEKVNFVVTDITSEGVFGSMRLAKEITEEPILKRLLAGEVMKGTVTYTTPYGVYISIKGVVSGMMKNYDFSDDGTEIREIYPKYSDIRVKYKKTTKNGNILFLPEQKRKGQILYDIEKIEKGQTYLGKITNISPDFDYIIVTINPGITVKCTFPAKYPDTKESDEVVITISSKMQKKGRYYLKGRVIQRVKAHNTNYDGNYQ